MSFLKWWYFFNIFKEYFSKYFKCYNSIRMFIYTIFVATPLHTMYPFHWFLSNKVIKDIYQRNTEMLSKIKAMVVSVGKFFDI